MKRRILLVDDELAILLTLRAILEMNDFEVDTASSAKEAEHKLKNGVFEMVITDMRMETETAGYDVIRAARQLDYNPATAILTAYPSLGNEWRSHGAQSLLVKPVNTAELLRQIEALSGQPPGPQDASGQHQRREDPATDQLQERASSDGR